MKSTKIVILATVFSVAGLAITNANENSFVVGGKEAAEGDYPWQVRILEGAEDSQGFCGGSVIAPNWILTAAHCIEDYFDDGGDVEDLAEEDLAESKEDESASSEIFIGYGSVNISKLTIVGAEKMMIHPHYKLGEGPDIALIKLNKNLPAGLVIPIERENIIRAGGKKVWVTGWGAQMDDEFDPSILLLYNLANGKNIRAALDGSNLRVPDKLRFAEMKTVEHAKCVETYNAFNDTRMIIDSGEICVGDPGTGKDSCYGDSGGPLVVKEEDNLFKQIGVVSWGYQCGHPFFPGVYASTAAYVDWLDFIMEQN